MVDAKSYCTVAQILRAGPSWVTDLSPDLTTCDTERRWPANPPLAHAPRDGITACDQVPHSDNVNYTEFRELQAGIPRVPKLEEPAWTSSVETG